MFNPSREQTRFMWPSFRAAEVKSAGTTEKPSAELLASFGYRSRTGAMVTPDAALRATAVFACVKVISEDIAKLPLKLYRRLPNGEGKKPATDHPLYVILHELPNRWQTAYEYKQMMIGHLLLRGNAYSYVRRDIEANVTELVPVHPDRVRLLPGDGSTLFYEMRDERNQVITGKPIPQRNVFHLRGLTQRGYLGVSPIAACCEAIGLALAAESHDAALLGNGATIPGAIKLEKNFAAGPLGDQQRASAREAFEAIHGGFERAGKAAIFEGGMSWQQIGISPADLQLMDLRKFQVPEICRIFRIAPHKIADLSRSSFSNIEQQAREHVDDCLSSWAVCLEQAITRDLLLPEERAELFSKLNFDALLRGDTLSRYRAHQIACGRPWATGNEVRDREDMNASDDPSMNEVALPLNVAQSADAAAEADKAIAENNRKPEPAREANQ